MPHSRCFTPLIIGNPSPRIIQAAMYVRKRKQAAYIKYGNTKRRRIARRPTYGRRRFYGKGYSRRTVRRGGKRFIPRACTSGTMAYIFQGETALTNGSTAITNYEWTLRGYDVPATDQVFSRYLQLFDEYKLVKIRYEIWLPESDEYTQANYKIPRLYYCYDPNSAIANFSSPTAAMIQRRPSHKEIIMRPGVVYKFNLYPKYAVFDVQTASTSNVTSRIATGQPSPWRPSGYAATGTDNSINCYMLGFLGSWAPNDEIIRYRRKYVYAFRSRTQGFMVNEV